MRRNALLFLLLVLFLPFILLLLVIAPYYAHAGTVGATHLLSRGPGAAASALGNSIISTVQDPTALYWNPAGMAFAGGAVSGEHLFLFDGARYNFLGLSVPSRFATFGLGALQLRRGNIIARARIDDPGYEVSNTQTAYMLGVARAIGEHWAVGATVNVLNFEIAGFRDRGYGMDLGVQGQFAGRNIGRFHNAVWSVGGVVKNLLEPRIVLQSDPEVFPREFRAGVSFGVDGFSRASLTAGEIRSDRMNLSLALQKVSDVPPPHLALGLSYNFRNILAFRLGYDREVVAGLGFETSNRKFAIDYSLENRTLTKLHRFTVTYRFSPRPNGNNYRAGVERDSSFVQVQNRAQGLSDEHLAAAKSLFQKKQFDEALKQAELAFLLNPEDRSSTSFYDRVKTVEEHQRVRNRLSVLSGSLRTDDRAAIQAAVSEILLRTPMDPAGFARAMVDVRGTLPISACRDIESRVFSEGKAQVLSLVTSGYISEAAALAKALTVVGEKATIAEGTRLRAWVFDAGKRLKAELSSVITAKSAAGDHRGALRALTALHRAFPQEDTSRLGGGLRSSYSAGRRLSPKDKIHLRKLYYLAAIRFAKGNFSRAADLLEEILRRDAMAEQASRLKELMIRKGILRERLAKRQTGE